MSIEIIQTSQSPDAKPVAISLSIDTDWKNIVTVPSYEVPEESFGGGSVIVPGVAEIISPLLISNKVSTTSLISIRIYRKETDSFFSLATDLPIAGNDTTPIPLNGQFLLTGDLLQLKSDTSNNLDVTLSYTVGQSEQDDVI